MYDPYKERKERLIIMELEFVKCGDCGGFFHFKDWENFKSIKETGACCSCYDSTKDAERPNHPDDLAGRG